MKKTKRYLTLILLGVFLFNTYYYLLLHKNFPDEPGDLTVVEDHLYLRYPVYFVGNERVVKDDITINHIWRDRPQNALDSYFAQGDLPYESRGDQILQIPIDKMIVTADRIYVYTQKAAFRDGRLNSTNFYYYLMSFVNTITEGSRKKAVSFIFDEKAEAPTLYGVDMNKTFSFDESVVHSNYNQIEEFIRKFFVDLYAGEYQLAFRNLTREFKRNTTLSDFTISFKNYVFLKNNEFPWDFIVEKEHDQYKVNVIFQKNGPVRNETWYVQEVNGKPYVSFSQDLLNNLP